VPIAVRIPVIGGGIPMPVPGLMVRAESHAGVVGARPLRNTHKSISVNGIEQRIES